MKSPLEIKNWLAESEESLRRYALSGDQRKKLELEIGVLRKVLDDYKPCKKCGFPNESAAGVCVVCGREFDG